MLLRRSAAKKQIGRERWRVKVVVVVVTMQAWYS